MFFTRLLQSPAGVVKMGLGRGYKVFFHDPGINVFVSDLAASEQAMRVLP